MDGSYVEDALDEALQRFQDADQRGVEEALDSAEDRTMVQLRKSCRLLEAARSLRSNDGYHTSVIELSLTSTERAIQFYLALRAGRNPGAFHDHGTVYEEGAAVNLYSQDLADQLLTLWNENRSAIYYRSAVATQGQADAAFILGEAVHRWIIDYASVGHECRCTSLPDDPFEARGAPEER